MFLKKITPNSLFGRFLLIITIPTILVQIVAIYIFYYNHIDNISKHMARGVLNEMLFIKNVIYVQGNTGLIENIHNDLDVKFFFQEGKKLQKKAKIFDKDYRADKILGFFNPLPVIDTLNRFKIELKSYNFVPFAIYKKLNDDSRLIVRIEVKDGILNFDIPKKRIISSTETVFVLWMMLTALLMLTISIIFLKNQIRPIKGLARAAEKFGRGQDVPDFKPSGAKEIRSVSISFLKMKERISRQILQRTNMLSGVSHDLRTPLTRMKLQLEIMGDLPGGDELKHDIADMEKMINGYLEFVKDAKKERDKNTKIKNFLEKIVTYYHPADKKIDCQLNLDDELEINIKPDSLKRAIRNLIDNALSYGDVIAIKAELHNNDIQIIVDDNGPGVPLNERENIFKPFYRIDNSRNLDKIGTGLGLAIVLDSVSSHGGKVRADVSPLGGLRIIVSLPI